MQYVTGQAGNAGLFENYAEILTDGGFFMWLIIATSVVLFATVVYKFISLNRMTVIPQNLLNLVEGFTEEPSEQKGGDLQESLEKNQSTLGLLCKTALWLQDEKKEDIEKAVEIKARDSIVKISSGMAILDVVITIAPLLGLLGTASGLVSVFSGLDAENTDHTALAKGISEALYTTIAGLAVAVPAVIAQSHFTRRIETMAASLELTLSKFIATIAK